MKAYTLVTGTNRTNGTQEQYRGDLRERVPPTFAETEIGARSGSAGVNGWGGGGGGWKSSRNDGHILSKENGKSWVLFPHATTENGAFSVDAIWRLRSYHRGEWSEWAGRRVRERETSGHNRRNNAVNQKCRYNIYCNFRSNEITKLS